MTKFIHYAAKAVNIIAILALLFFMLSMGRSHEHFLFLLVLVAPVLSMWALLDGAGPTERKLQKEIRIARLQKELKDLQNKEDRT